MVILREMRQEEFPAYCQYFIDDYSCEIAQNYGYPMVTAIELAEKDLHQSFPNGLESKDHSLLCIDTEIDGTLCLVGYLWHSINIKKHLTFIYDFYISDKYRSQGFGKQTLSLLEEQLQLIGVKEIKLRVAYHNNRALRLYQKVGFVITGYNMSKPLL